MKMNTPHPDGLVLKECWRRPARPFKKPECCGVEAYRLRFGMFRCPKCASRIWPERLHHRLLLWWNPFRYPGDPGVFRHLFHVTRWAKP